MNSVVSSAALRDFPTQPNRHVPAMNRGAIFTDPYGANKPCPAFPGTKPRLKR